MRFLKRSTRSSPRISLVLLDWSVRESFHLLHYLAKQTVPREAIEVIVIEFYSRVSDAVKRFEDQVDTWVALDVPERCYYHKHLMYNVGIALARGEIVMIGDSDAMVRETFIESILRQFDANPGIVLHLDQFRNGRRELYPFEFPSFEEVLAEGCINNAGGVTTGVRDTQDPIHTRNYGACMCALRRDLIAIGGADMHLDYLGHICGPYDMTFRLANFGRREIWDAREFLYHTWHPGQAGADNYLGPHDGRHVSTTALAAIGSGRVQPLLENAAIRRLRTGEASAADEVLGELVDPRLFDEWDAKQLALWTDYRRPLGTYKGFRLTADIGEVRAHVATPRGAAEREPAFRGLDLEDTRRRIDAATPARAACAAKIARACDLLGWAASVWRARSLALPVPLSARAKLVVGALLALPAALAIGLVAPRAVARKLVDVSRREPSLSRLVLAAENVATFGNLGGPDTRAGVLVDGRRARLCLRALVGLRLLPRLEVHLAHDVESAERALQEASAPAGAWLISESLWPRVSAAFTRARADARAIVV